MRGWIVAGLVVLAVSGAGLGGRDDMQQDAPADMTVDDHAPDAFSRMQGARPATAPAEPAGVPPVDVATPAITD